MDLKIFYSIDSKKMNEDAKVLFDKGYKEHSKDENYILLKKRFYGNFYIHLIFILFALFVFSPLLFLNIIYFAYNFIKKSFFVLITTETKDQEGNDLEFDEFDELLD